MMSVLMPRHQTARELPCGYGTVTVTEASQANRRGGDRGLAHGHGRRAGSLSDQRPGGSAFVIGESGLTTAHDRLG